MSTQADRHTEDLAFLRRDAQWPQWPFCPLKRDRKDKPGGWPECGLVVAGERAGAMPTVYLVNLFGLGDLKKEGKWLKDVPQTKYDTLDQLLADGWYVD